MSLIFENKEEKKRKKAVNLTEDELFLLDQVIRKHINDVKDLKAKESLKNLLRRIDLAYSRLTYRKIGREVKDNLYYSEVK